MATPYRARTTSLDGADAPTSSTSPQPIRVAVIGTGFGAAVHIPALQYLDETEVVAVCSRRAERAKAIAARHGIPTATSDFRDVTHDPDVDAVIIASPPYLHHTMAIAALEARKHVLCEKPMARNLAENRDMVKLAETAGVVAMINHEFRYLPVRARVKELIEEGYIGEPQAASMIVYRSSLADPNERPFGWLMEQDKAGGMLLASGSHHIDALRWWFGDIHAVAGITTTMVKKRRLADSTGMATVDADDNFACLLRFANGALATIHVSATAPTDVGEQITLSGTEGMLIVEGDGQLYGARRRDVDLRELPIPERLGGDLPEFPHFLTRPTTLLLRDWARAIREGNWADFSASFADGAKVQEVIDGVMRSGTQGRWIDTSGSRWPLSSAI